MALRSFKGLDLCPAYLLVFQPSKQVAKRGVISDLHCRVGITIVIFLLVQAGKGLFLSLGTLASDTGSQWFHILEIIHTNWDPVGSLYRIILGLGIVIQSVLGIIIISMSRDRYKKK